MAMGGVVYAAGSSVVWPSTQNEQITKLQTQLDTVTEQPAMAHQIPSPAYPPQPDPPLYPADPAPPAAVAPLDRVTQLKELAELKEAGMLTEEEFQQEKQRILAGG
jgi:hypothetical protein